MRSLFHPFHGRRFQLPLPTPSKAMIAGFALGALLVLSMSQASAADRREAQARYQQERAACLNGQSHQERSTCLREAAAALQEARRGTLAAASPSYDQNRAARCDPLPPDLRQDCQRRMKGEGTVSGSVEQGGILRELRTVVPAN